jgi:hypothetical protein
MPVEPLTMSFEDWIDISGDGGVLKKVRHVALTTIIRNNDGL